MSLTPDSIKKPSKRVTDEANNLVKGYLQDIDAKINSCPKKLGWNHIIYDLPTYFPLEGLQKRDGQALIYGLILSDLAERKLERKLILGKDKTLLVIRFEITPNKKELEVMQQYIKESSISINELSDFVKGKNVTEKKK